ncbi:MAG: hypothetical protein EBR28_13715, partial [Planctomycetia bacterium]|nr:hypothetical protein [Planctomycetia bacterium]
MRGGRATHGTFQSGSPASPIRGPSRGLPDRGPCGRSAGVSTTLLYYSTGQPRETLAFLQTAPATPPENCDILVVGAGAAGLFAATWAGRTARAAGRPLSVVALDGARKLGAKILVAGGGRCNVTHWKVTEADYAGSTPPAIRKVLGRFTVDETVRFFAECGVALKREDTGKLFPVTDSARTVLDALVGAAASAIAKPPPSEPDFGRDFPPVQRMTRSARIAPA